MVIGALGYQPKLSPYVLTYTKTVLPSDPIVLAKATAIRQGRQRREEWKWIIVLSG